MKENIPTDTSDSTTTNSSNEPQNPTTPEATAPTPSAPPQPYPVGFWDLPLVITPNAFQHKSLSDFSANIAVGCSHGCSFCYVPSVSTIKQTPLLNKKGVKDPDSEWGIYVYLRTWDKKKFKASAIKADQMTPESLSKDGHRAVMFCSTTDPYQIIKHPDKEKQKELNDAREAMVRDALIILRDETTLNVRILTRSPLVKKDFELLKTFGNRITLGVSLPTLRADLAKLYEPDAPAPAQRLKLLKQAKEAGIPVYVAMAPTFPESDYEDLLATLAAIKEIDPITIFHEPINIRAENVARIKTRADELGVPFKGEMLENKFWPTYALTAFSDMEKAAKATGLFDKLHLWIDKALGSQSFVNEQADPTAYAAWRDHWWNRISEWPGQDPRPKNSEIAPPNPFFTSNQDILADDLEYRESREKIVTEGLNAGLRAAQALHEIKTHKNGLLWKKDFKSFQEYCQTKWGYAKTHAYRLLECGSFIKELNDANAGKDGGKLALPLNENQVRPIMSLPPSKRVEAWASVIEAQPVDELTGAIVAEKIKARLPAKAPKLHQVPIEVAVAEPPEVTPIEILTTLETRLTAHPKYTEIVKFIESIRELVAA